jgi:prepilin-type processing-associated H-X9-DG protein
MTTPAQLDASAQRRGAMSKPTRTSGRTIAFTLVEVLIVITVVALLIALTLPSLRRARDSADATQCLSNMRQLLAATRMYMTDFAHRYPQPFEDSDIEATADAQTMTAALWFNALDPYLGKSAVDYTTERNNDSFKQDPIWQQMEQADQITNRTIKMNKSFGHQSPAGTIRFTRESEITRPAKTVLFIDGRADDIREDLFAAFFHVSEGTVGLRHDHGVNVAFPDGHAARHKQEERTDTAAPSWYVQGDSRQKLIWDFD